MAIKRLYDTLVGGTVAWNQLVPISSTSISTIIQGVTFVDNRDGSYTFYTGENGASANATFRIISKIDGGSPQHVYYLKGNAEGSSISTWHLADQYNGVFNYNFKKENIVKVLTDTPARLDLRVVVASGTVISVPVTIKPQVIDLTLLLGSTIADYIYTLETATSGAGIAKLREWGFCTGYVPYNAGSIESVEVTEKKVVGFNLFDKDSSYVGNSYKFFDVPSGKNYRLYIAFVDKNTSVDVSGIYFGFVVDNSGSAPSYIWNLNNGNVSNNHSNITNAGQTAGLYCSYAFMYPNTEDAFNRLTQRYNICINISSDRNGEYEPYHSQSYPLGNDVLRGIFKLDANNNLYADGDRKEADGTITRRYGIVDLGTLSWALNGENSVFAYVPIKKVGSRNVICDKLTYSSAQTISGVPDNGFRTYDETNGIAVKVSGITVSNAATMLSGMTLVYELATPTTEQSTPFPSPQVCYPDGTEEYVTSNGVPVGHETRYQL